MNMKMKTRKKQQRCHEGISKIELKIWYKFHAWTKRFADIHTKNYGFLSLSTRFDRTIIIIAAAAAVCVCVSFISFFCSISFHFIFQSGIS